VDVSRREPKITSEHNRQIEELRKEVQVKEAQVEEI